jgi:N utilization substance protein B
MKKTQRRIIREKVLQILYAYEFNKEGLQASIDEHLIWNGDPIIKEFGESLINKVIINCKEFDSIIKKKVKNWQFEQIAVIDLILLRMGLCELFYFPEIPPKVSINEIIEISKEYSVANSGGFINGILAKVLTELREEGKLNKKGRGLIDESISTQEDK